MADEMIGLTKAPQPIVIGGQSDQMHQAALVQAFFSNPAIPEEEKVKLRERYAARNSLLKFITYTKPNYKVNWHHEIICNEIDDFLRSKTRNRLMIWVGPRRGKTEIVSRRLVAYAFGLNPDLNIISTSYGADLAKANSRDAQRIIDSDKYRELFPRTTLSSTFVKSTSKKTFVRTSDRFEIVDATGSYRAAGIGGGITGAGADLGVIDDVIKDWKEALSTQKKQAAYDWYTSTFLTRLSKSGKIIILMTRWSDDDLCGRLLKEAQANPESDQWEVISFPEMADPENEYQHPLDQREEGEVLWPDMFDEKRVHQIKHSVGTKVWTSLFQQQPKPGDGTVFKISWFKYYDEMPTFERISISWDFNFGNNLEGSDYVAGTVWGHKGANKYLIYMVRERLSFMDSLGEVVRLHLKYPTASYTVIEGKANGPAIVDAVKSKIPGVVVYMPTSSKVARAFAASPQFEAGNILLPNMYYRTNRETHTWAIKLLPLMIEEFKAFPFVDHDDMVDSCVQMILRELEAPAWLQNVTSDASVVKTEHSARDLAVAAIFKDAGYGDVLGTEYNPEDGAPVYRLGF